VSSIRCCRRSNSGNWLTSPVHMRYWRSIATTFRSQMRGTWIQFVNFFSCLH
jgi:hypothetical protein